jgi:hypothetical protein
VWAPGAPEVELELLGDAELETEEAWVSERFGQRDATSLAVARVVRELPASIGFRVRCLI